MTTLENELLDLLEMMFIAHEDGVPCYEDPENTAVYIGKAVLLDDKKFKRVAEILNEHRPVPGYLDKF